MAGCLNLSAKKAVGTSAMAMLVVAVLLIALTCVSGVEASNAVKEQVPTTSSKKSWGSTLRASYAVGNSDYARIRFNHCTLFPSICYDFQGPGFACCSGSCVNLKSHPGHCGKCNRSCLPARSCCNGKCKSLSRDNNHCGACNKKCSAGSRCAYGLCGY